MKSLGRSPLVTLTLACLAFPLVVAGSDAVFAQAASQSSQESDQLKQIALTEKQVQGVLAAQKDMDAITSKIPDNADAKPDPKLLAQLDDVAKKNGFASYAQYTDVVDNIGLVMSGIDPQTKAFLQPPDALKKQIAAVQADTKMPAKDKKQALDEMTAALKTTPPVQFPDNVALVTKYYDKLTAALEGNQ